MLKETRIVVIAVALGILFTAVYGETDLKLIADMEEELPQYKIYGQKAEPKVSVTASTASQGKKSLRFEYTGEGKDKAWLRFPVDGAKGFNAIAFDIFCESVNGSSMEVVLRNGTRYKGQLKIGNFVDGWTSVRLVKDKSLILRGEEKDWGKIKHVYFLLIGNMAGKCVYYLDNIRFEKVGEESANMLYNSSFEITTNPDVPDGWSNNWYRFGPYGKDIWGIDRGIAFHGKNSLRITTPEKVARSWVRHTHVIKGKDYTFSVYLKGNKDSINAKLGMQGMGGKNITVTTEWMRYLMTCKAARTVTSVYVGLLSEAILWIDAAQLEIGTVPTPYSPSFADSEKPYQRVAKSKTLKDLKAIPVEIPRVAIKRARESPIIDGRLNDPCWKDAPLMGPFVKLRQNKPARRKTIARMCYDDKAFYFAVVAEEPDMEAVNTLVEKENIKFWKADLIELFIDLNHDRQTYYHFAVNVNNEHYEARHTTKDITKDIFEEKPSSWRCDWKSKVKANKDGWILEARIPYTCFDLQPDLKVKNVIGVNVTREDPRNKEHSSWAFSHGAFHAPEAFGEVNGIDLDISRYRFEVVELDWYRGVAQATIRNHTGKKQRVKISFVVEGPLGVSKSANTNGTIGAKRDQGVFSVPLSLQDDGYYKVFVKLYDKTGNLCLVSQPVGVQVSSESILDLVGTEFDFYTNEKEAQARCFIEAGKERCKGLKINWWLEQDGHKVSPSAHIQPQPGINQWTIPIEKLPNGNYILKLTLNGNGKILAQGNRHFRKLPPAKHEVRINQWGRFLICDGKPFFWYGFFHGMPSKYYPHAYPQWVEDLKDMKKAHCTAVLDAIGYENLDKIGWALDHAQANGLKMWVHLGSITCYWIPKYAHLERFKNEDEAIQKLREVVNKNKNHPALLGWCTIDEPGNRPHLFTKEYTERYYHLVKELDPYHPCIFSHLNHIDDVKRYGGATDLVLMPFVDRSSSYEGKFYAFWNKGFTIAANSPCYGASGNTCREPTPKEQRVRMYKSLILGSRGLSTYTYRCITSYTWQEFCRIGKELQVLAPILLTPDNHLRVEVIPRNKDIFALLKAKDNTYYLFAVNTALNPVEVCFQLVDVPKVKNVLPMFDTKRARVNTTAKTLTVSMEAQSTAVYKIRQKK